MIELYLSKVTETSESEQAGKLYARVDYKQSLSVQDMAHHMAEHNTAFSEGLITGILIDFVRCVREQVLNGNTVKIENLAIFKATVEANALEKLYDAEQDKTASATIGTLPEGANVTSLRYSNAKDHPDNVWLKGKVNGIDVFGLLSTNETTAVRNKLATLDQVAAANKDFSQKVADIVSGKQQGVSENDAVKAIVDRASDSTAKAFTPEQVGYITKFLGDIDGDGRMDVAEELWGKAKNDLDAKAVNSAWQEDAHNELKDLAQGILRSEQQLLKR